MFLPLVVLKTIVTCTNESKCTIKGFRLNYENDQILNHESMVKVIESEVKDLVTVDENEICRDSRNKTIVNRYQEKVYKFGYDKRAIMKLSENHIETLTIWLLK